MPDLTDYAKNLLGRALCARVPALPSQVFLGLGTGGSDPTGLTGEPTANGYARQPVTFTGTGAQQNTDAVRFTFTARDRHADACRAVRRGQRRQSADLVGAGQRGGGDRAGTVTINAAGLVLTPG